MLNRAATLRWKKLKRCRIKLQLNKGYIFERFNREHFNLNT